MSAQRKLTLVSWMLLSTLSLSACDTSDDDSSSPTPEETPPTFQFVEEKVLTLSCDFSGCHAGSSASAGLDFSEADLYTRIVNVASTQRTEMLLVKPGDATNSYLVQKLTDAEGIVGDKMPPDGEIEPEYLQAVIDWIDAGAPNN